MGMPTKRLYYLDQYIKSFESRVEAVSEEGDLMGVVLEETAFYPRGGGQPSDTGTLAGGSWKLRVESVEERGGGEIVHLGRADGRPSEGDPVRGTLDWDRRYRLMRMHTAAHILMASVSRVFGRVVDVVGSGLSVERGRMDFAERIRANHVPDIEAAANKIIASDVEVRAAFFPREGAREILAKYGRNLGAPQAGMETVRIVEISGVDADPCGGTHVSRTSEVGSLRILKRDNKGRGVTRLVFSVEP